MPIWGGLGVGRPPRLAPGDSRLREWQREALPLIVDALKSRPVLVEACPGAGKTRFGLEVAYEAISTGLVERVIVVSPTLAVVNGWQRSTSPSDRHAPTIPLLNGTDWDPDRPLPLGWRGLLTTYQGLFRRPDALEALCCDPEHPTLVIFDEVHHLGDESSWGAAARSAFAQHARAILALSGTPFRSDRDRIPFLRDEDGMAIADFVYDYDRALHDGACRPIHFVASSGIATYSRDDQVRTLHLGDDLVDDQAKSDRLRTALTYLKPGSIARTILTEADATLDSLRSSGATDAAGLVVAMDCSHAQALAQVLSDITGTRPVVACSTFQDLLDPSPQDAITAFRASTSKWLITVNMASEGVDIPRLRVLAYLTNTLTDLRFRQICGRIVRTDPTSPAAPSVMYIPGDPRLIQLAQSLHNDPIFLPAIGETSTNEQSSEDGFHRESRFSIISSQHSGYMDLDVALETDDLEELARRYVASSNLRNTTPEALVELARRRPHLRERLQRHQEEEESS